MPLDQALVHTRSLADELQVIISACGCPTEVVRLIHDDKVVLAFLPEVALTGDNLVQAAIAHKLSVSLDAEEPESLRPVLLQGRRINHQYIGVSAVRLDESLGYHRGDDSLAETHHVGKEETVVLHQHLIALYHGIVLIANILYAFWHLHREIILHLRAEGINQHLHVDFVRRRQCTEVGLCLHLLNVLHIQWHGILPKRLKLMLAIFHIVVILHRHVQLVAAGMGGAQP